MVDNPVQLHIDFENLQVSDQEDECYSGVSDVSVELQLLEYSPEQPASLNIERSIVSYLKELGIKMKTDPRAKQERYFKRKRQFKRAQTTFMEEKEINSTTMTPPQISKKPTMQLQMNSIIGRRTPQNLGSTPLLQFPNKVTENLNSAYNAIPLVLQYEFYNTYTNQHPIRYMLKFTTFEKKIMILQFNFETLKS